MLEQSHAVVLVALLGNEPVGVHAEEPSKPKFDPTPRRRDWISSGKLGLACGGARAHQLSSHKITICRDVHNLELKFGHGFPELLVGFAMSVEAPDTGQQRAGNDDVRCDLLAGRVKIVGVVNRDVVFNDGLRACLLSLDATSFLLNQMCTYLFPYTRKLFSPATGLYSPSCRALIPFSHVSLFDAVWKVVSPTNLLCVGLSMKLFPL